MRNAHLATKDSTSSLENGRIEGGLSSEVIKMKDDSPLSGPGELDLAKLVDEVLGEMPGPGSAESGKMPLYQPNTLPLEMSPHAARLALEEAQRAKEKRRKEVEELGQMKTAAVPMDVLDLQRAAAEAVVPGLAVQPKPASVVVVPAPAPAAAPASAKAEAKVETKKAEAKPIQVRSAEVKDSAKATVLTTAKALEKRSSAGRWVMIGMGLVAVAAASTAGWLAYKKSPLLGHASAATPAVTAPATTAAAPATPPPEAHANASPASAAPEAKPPTTAEAKSEEPKPEAKAAAPEAKPAEAKAEEPAAPTTKPKRKVAASAPEPKAAPEAKAEEPAPKPAPAAKAPEPKPAPAPVAAKAPEPKAEAKPAAPPAQPSSVDAILQQQLKGAIP